MNYFDFIFNLLINWKIYDEKLTRFVNWQQLLLILFIFFNWFYDLKYFSYLFLDSKLYDSFEWLISLMRILRTRSLARLRTTLLSRTGIQICWPFFIILVIQFIFIEAFLSESILTRFCSFELSLPGLLFLSSFYFSTWTKKNLLQMLMRTSSTFCARSYWYMPNDKEKNLTTYIFINKLLNRELRWKR